MSRVQFAQLCSDFKAHFKEKYGCDYEEYIRTELIYEKPNFSSLEQALFFTLFQKKNDLIYDSLGAVFGMSEPSAHRNYDKFNLLLEETLLKKKLCR